MVNQAFYKVNLEIQTSLRKIYKKISHICLMQSKISPQIKMRIQLITSNKWMLTTKRRMKSKNNNNWMKMMTTTV